MLRTDRRTNHSRLAMAMATVSVASFGFLASGVAAQEPEPGAVTHSVAPGTFFVADSATRVTKAGKLKLAVRCVDGNVACEGTVKLTSLKPVLPGGERARRTLTIAEGSIGRIPAGEGRYVSFTIDKSSRVRLRSFNKIEALWQSYWADGSVQYVNLPHTITVRRDTDR